MKVKTIETLSCDAGWRNYHFVKLSNDTGIAGWSEFDAGFGAPSVGTVIDRLSTRVVGQDVSPMSASTRSSLAQRVLRPAASSRSPWARSRTRYSMPRPRGSA